MKYQKLKIREQINKINSKLNMNSKIYKDKSKEITQINNLLGLINFRGGLKDPKKGKNGNSVLPQLKKVENRNIHVNRNNLFEKKGILDPEGKAPNPFTGKPYENLWANAEKFPNTYAGYGAGEKGWSKLPMYSKSEEVIEKIYDNQIIFIISGTGSGKTVLTPKLALHAMNYEGRILITNPKQKPSEENAEYAAKTLDVQLGDEVGLKFRGSNPKYYSDRSKLIYCTDGYVLKRIKTDPMMKDFDCLIIDEAHERNVRIDMLLLETKELIERRPDFKLIIMSATINPDIFRNYFPNSRFKFAELDAGQKPNKPVKEIFLEPGDEINKFDKEGTLINRRDFMTKMVDIIIDIIKTSDEGDILAFVTGEGEGNEVCGLLQNKLRDLNNNNKEKIYCVALSGGTKGEPKELAIHKDKYKTKNGGYNRKLVVATEVAESSLTVDGLIYVIDSGLVNDQRYYALTNIEELAKRYISRASHKQRRGRIGRTAPGFCYNLFTEKEYENDEIFPEYSKPPILTENITPYILNFLNKMDVVSHVDLPFKYVNTNKTKNGEAISLNEYLTKLIEKPPEETVAEMVKRLIALGALRKDGNKAYLTDIGVGMNEFDNIGSIELGRALLSSWDYKCSTEMCQIAALIEIIKNQYEKLFKQFKDDKKKSNEERKAMRDDYEKKKKKWSSSEGDLISFLKAYKEYEVRKYDKVDRKTNEVIEEKMGGAKEWCQTNYFNDRTMEQIRKTAKDYKRKLVRLVRAKKREFENNPNNKNKEFFFTHREKPIVERDTYKNVVSALIDGLYVNMIRKANRNNYISCFTKIKKMSGLSDRNLYDAVKIPAKFLCYVEFGSIFGRTNFRIVTPISPLHLQRIKVDKEKAEHLSYCLYDTKFNKLLKNSSSSSGKSSKGYKKKTKKYGKKKW
jgi:HrpA-like RNA helicase